MIDCLIDWSAETRASRTKSKSNNNNNELLQQQQLQEPSNANNASNRIRSNFTTPALPSNLWMDPGDSGPIDIKLNDNWSQASRDGGWRDLTPTVKQRRTSNSSRYTHQQHQQQQQTFTSTDTSD